MSFSAQFNSVEGTERRVLWQLYEEDTMNDELLAAAMAGTACLSHSLHAFTRCVSLCFARSLKHNSILLTRISQLYLASSWWSRYTDQSVYLASTGQWVACTASSFMVSRLCLWTLLWTRPSLHTWTSIITYLKHPSLQTSLKHYPHFNKCIDKFISIQ